MTTATGRAAAYATLAVGVGLALVAGAQPWWHAVVPGDRVPLSGDEASGNLTQALALVSAAGLLLSLTLRVRGRQVIGGVLALAGAGMAGLGLARPRPSEQAVQDATRMVSLAVEATLEPTGWSWAYAGAGLLAVVGGVLLLALAPRWGSRRPRFDRGPVEVDLADPTAIWKALDAGVDPTDETAVTSPQQDATQDRKSQR